MNKVLARNLFSKYTPKARAHGTGITKLVVDDEGAQHLAGGTGPQGVVPATSTILFTPKIMIIKMLVCLPTSTMLLRAR